MRLDLTDKIGCLHRVKITVAFAGRNNTMKGTLYILFTLSVCFIASSRAQVYFSYSNDNCTELIGAYKVGNVSNLQLIS